MKAELQEKEVLAMYDVRGIQGYIFKSNVAKEIIGASVLVEKIITEGLKAYIREQEEAEQKYYMTEWEQDDPEAFLKDKAVKMQIMFVGGGNAYVLFRKGAECEHVNRFLAKYLLEKTYSLKEEISKQMRQEYQIDFHTKLSENALYRMVYRAYITELKQFVRTIEKGGESK